MHSQLLAYIQREALFTPEDKLLLAVSGGLDSVCLLHMLVSLKYKPAVAHVNFGLRGKDSDEDARFVENLARQYGLEFHIRRLDAYKAANASEQSIQMAARKLRYAWFRQLQKTYGYKKLVLAHHADDLTETLLLNISRGTGLAGLKGMPTNENRIVRPLIFADKSDLVAYAKEYKLNWREDSSNQKTDYKRNFIRHKVVPLLKEQNPKLNAVVQTATTQAASAEKIITHLINTTPGLIQEKDAVKYINSVVLLQLPEPQLILHYIIKTYGFSWQQSEQVITLMNGASTKSGKQWFSGNWLLAVNRNELVLSEAKQAYYGNNLIELNEGITESVPYNWELKTLPGTDYNIPKEKTIVQLDAEKVKGRLWARPWQQGDRFRPLGMAKGTKKLSDFMIDRKIPLNLKKLVWVVHDEENIVWVAAHQLDDRYKITSSTQKIIQLRQIRHD